MKKIQYNLGNSPYFIQNHFRTLSSTCRDRDEWDAFPHLLFTVDMIDNKQVHKYFLGCNKCCEKI